MTIIHLIISKIKSTFSSPVYRLAFSNGFCIGCILGIYACVLTQMIVFASIGANQ